MMGGWDFSRWGVGGYSSEVGFLLGGGGDLSRSGWDTG